MDSWFLILLVISVSVARVDSQLDSNGFINIDCGRAPNSSFFSSVIKSNFVSDDQFIDTGENRNIDSKIQSRFEELLTVRSFPNGTRNCYTLRSLTVGSKYLVRGQFMYGNYDNLNYLPTFEVHLGVNYWDKIVITTADVIRFTEIIAAATSDYLQVCLVNINHGTPFISALHLSELKPTMYNMVNFTTQSLVCFNRENMGASDFLRYPDDPHDRFWGAYTWNEWKNISTNSTVDTDTDFETPSAVMQTAVTTLNTTQPLSVFWSSDNKFFVVLHMSEIGALTSTDVRKFDILADGFSMLDSFEPEQLQSFSFTYYSGAYNTYNFSLQATSNSTLPPLLNAYESYIITSASGIPTNNGDVTAINTIKVNYKVNKGWSGDPCVPKEYSWTGVTCTVDSTNIPRMTALDLSSSGLAGVIISSFGNLSALKSLDLSNNDLTGDLPAFLDQLSSLTYLDITGNKNLSTTLPPGLESKRQDGKLTFWSGANDKNKKIPVVKLAVVIGVVVLLLIAATIIIIVCLRRRKLTDNGAIDPISETPGASFECVVINDFRVFQLSELKLATNKFSEENKLGEGGFGPVFKGALRDGKEIAVKRLAGWSKQGLIEFKNEVDTLAKLRHKNLVILLGYCLEKSEKLLCYEYLPSGSLDWILSANDEIKREKLSWQTRFKIIEGISSGLEYLHVKSGLKIIHRDLKPSNILLDEDMNPKISDFGLARLYQDDQTHKETSIIAGTYGYMAPEYAMHGVYSEKLDVYAFGMMLLEIVTGRKNSSFCNSQLASNLTSHAWQHWAKGEVELLKDPAIEDVCLDQMSRCVHIGLLCVQESPNKRPSMDFVNFLLCNDSNAIPPLPEVMSGPSILLSLQNSISTSNTNLTHSTDRTSSSEATESMITMLAR